MAAFKIVRENCDVPPCFCIGPRSFQADRTVAATDTMILPGTQSAPHIWEFELVEGVTRSNWIGRKEKLLVSLKPWDTLKVADQLVIDFRVYSPDNFAHFLCFHIPFLAAVTQELGIALDDIKVVLPARLPGYITGLVDVFGLDVVMTNQPVSGRIVSFSSPLEDELRGARRGFVEAAGFPAMLEAKAAASPNSYSGRYFIARRGARSLENMDEVSQCLDGHGYKTVYMEDLSLIDQFKLMQNAQSLVAIHGAGLASFLYINQPERLQSLIEIMPVGLASTFFREMAHAMGVHYVATRGRLKPEYIPAIYTTRDDYLQHQNDTFSADPAALEQAIDFAERRLVAKSWLEV